MALQNFIGAVWAPPPMLGLAGGLMFGDLILDAAGEKAAAIVQVPKTGSIAEIGFRVGAVTTSADLKVGLYTVDASGNPTTTAYGGMVAGVQATPTASTAYTVALGTAATATAGDIVAVVIEFNSAAGNLRINDFRGTSSNSQQFPYTALFTTSWSKSTATPITWLKYSDGSYSFMPGVLPAATSAELSFASNNATQDEVALRFRLPVPSRLAGFGGVIAQLANFDAVLYEDTTALLTYSLAASQVASSLRYPRVHKFPTPYVLAANTTYRLALKPTTTTNITVAHYDVAAAAVFNQVEGGPDFHWSQRVDAGAWTDTVTRRPFIWLLLDQFDDGVGGGGGGPAPMLRAA